MKWDPCLKAVEPPKVQFQPFELSEAQKSQLVGYRDIQFRHAGYLNLKEILVKGSSLEGMLDSQWHWVGQMSPPGKGSCRIQVKNKEEDLKEVDAFCKITHVLEPIQYLKDKAFSPEKKINDPMNQAFVENLSYYCTSRLREQNLSPHFSFFYGSFGATADSYLFNVSEEYLSYKNTKWFWNAYDKKQFQIKFETFSEETSSEIAEFTARPEVLEDDSTDNSSDSDESLDADDVHHGDDRASMHSVDELSFTSGSDDTDDTEGSTEYKDPSFHLEIPNFPVLCMYLEKSSGVMDDLLHDVEGVGADPGTQSWEDIWSAWVFQVIAALCTIQHTLSMTHNDLHTNNIMWTDTEDEYIYYNRKDGTVWRVPTYGKIFRIIDFGRAIFRLKNKVIYSDDFKDGNDAATQYNFGPMRDANLPEVMPNPSFDLCRFAVSAFEWIFPDEPPKKEKNAKVLSSEEGLTIRETTSDLFNLMWTWMITDMGENVLINADGEEKYPNFDLYKVIAGDCHEARPCDQVDKKPFSNFKVNQSEVPEGQKIYSLFF
jgi:hypothetical protein